MGTNEGKFIYEALHGPFMDITCSAAGRIERAETGAFCKINSDLLA